MQAVCLIWGRLSDKEDVFGLGHNTEKLSGVITEEERRKWWF
jgi:hypothetical protein